VRRIEPVAGPDDLDIPMPSMAPAYRVRAAQRSQQMDPATRRLAIFASVIGGALVLMVGVWSFTGHRQSGVPVIEPDSRPLRVKPANPGGLQVAGANDGILSGETDGKSALAPPPEAPELQKLQAEQETATQPAPAPASRPAPTSAASGPESPPTPPATPASAAPASAPTAPSAVAHPAMPAAPQAAARAEQPRPVAAAAATPKPAAKPAAESQSGSYVVQLAAVENEANARAEWERLAHKYGDLLNGRRPIITKFERSSDNKIFWRLRTGGFTTEAQAAEFCAQIKAKGGGCSVGRS
jgi:septal ring-binding cell division protein DamX